VEGTVSNYVENSHDEAAGRRRIPARRFVDDMRSGMPDSALMEKYKLTARGLHSAFRKLLAANVVQPSELVGRHSEYDETIDVNDIRALQRDKVEFPLPIYELNNPDSRGIISDITIMGVGITGFETDVGDIRQFVIPADEFFQVNRVEFKARCRWVKRDESDGECVSGFEIMKVSRGSLAGLRRLIQGLTLSERQVKAS
jgi:hypothetical protein